MRLRFVADVNPPVSGFGRQDAGTEVTFLPLDRIWSDERFDPSETIEFTGDLRSYNPVGEGDLLVPKVSPTFAHGRTAIARGLENGRALATSEVFVVRPHDPAATRFLQYRLLARDFLAEGEASWFGVAGLKRVSSDFLRDLHLDESAWKQRELIADFLDSESERLVALNRKLAMLDRRGEELAASEIDEVFGNCVLGRLGWLAQVQTGLTLGRGYSAEPETVELPYLRVANVLADRIDTDQVASVTVTPIVARQVMLREGDVLMTEGGDIDKLGRGAVWDARIDPCLHQNHVFAVRCGSLLLPEVLALWTRGSVARQYFERTASRITNIASTNVTKLRALPVPTLEVAAQARLLDRHASMVAPRRALQVRGAAMRAALTEYRDALITEAVTGRLDVTRVSGAQMDERAHAAMERALAP